MHVFSIASQRLKARGLALGILFAIYFVTSLSVFAQNANHTFSLSFKDKPLTAILDMVARQGDYIMSYTDEVKAYSTTLTVSLDSVTTLQATQQLLSHTPFTYSVNGANIKVFRLEQQQESGQHLEGTIKDHKGLGVPFAIVRLKGTTKGVQADDNGKFSLPVNKATGEVLISCLGYDAQSVAYTLGKPLSVTLKATSTALGEVQVIAYGKRSQRDLVGAVSSVKSDQIQNAPTPSIENLLQSRMAGVEITNLSGTPGGGGSQVTIRGFSSLNQQGVNDGSPLYVIDGVPVTSTTSVKTGGINTLAGLDPSSIESVQVLKDAASAALYGSRAGNGVILITTKKGKSGKAEFNVNVSQTYSWLPATPVQIMGKGERDFATLLALKQRLGHYDWATDNVVMPGSHNDTWGWDSNNDGAYDYFWRNGAVLNGENSLPGIVQDSLNTFYNNRTNWWKYAFRVGRITKADATISGGKDNVRYMVNAGLYDEKGIMISSNFQRFSLLSNLDINLTPRLSFYLRTNLAYTDKNSGGSMGKIQGLTFDPKETPSLLPGKGSVAEREALRRLQDVKRSNTNYNLRLNGGINYQILKGLKFSSSVALDHYFTRSYTFTPDYLGYNKLSKAEGADYAMTMIQNENLLTYNFNLKEAHNFELMAGMTYNRDLALSLSGSAMGGPTNQITYIGEGWPKLRTNEYGTPEALQSVLSNKEEQAMQSFLGRFTYNYRQRYLTEFSIRTDGSSVFGRDVRWGTFPAAGLGWVFSEEQFLKDFWWMNFGKLRASWGRSGQKFQEPYLALGVMAEANTFFGNLGLIPTFMANNKLTWEKSDQYDLGLDFYLLDSRLRFKFDYYYKYSDALLMQTPLPGNFFLTDKMWNNASAISNEGIEFEVEGDVYRNKNFKWTVGANFSSNRNMFRKSYGNVDLTDKVLGRPVYGIYTYHDEGIVQDEKDIPYYYNQQGKRMPLYFGTENNPLRVGGRKITDQNSDGKIDSQDLYYAGSTLPKLYGGITNHVEWNGFTLDVLMSYVIGRKMMNMVRNSAFLFTKKFGVVMNDYRKATFWQKPGEKADYPSLEFADQGYIGQFDGNIDSNIENVSYLRLKQLTLGYNLPTKWTKALHLKGCNLYLSGENLFLITNYSGVDPEVVDPYTGKDLGDQYPLNRKVTLGINLKF